METYSHWFEHFDDFIETQFTKISACGSFTFCATETALITMNVSISTTTTTNAKQIKKKEQLY